MSFIVPPSNTFSIFQKTAIVNVNTTVIVNAGRLLFHLAEVGVSFYTAVDFQVHLVNVGSEVVEDFRLVRHDVDIGHFFSYAIKTSVSARSRPSCTFVHSSSSGVSSLISICMSGLYASCCISLSTSMNS